MLVHLLLAAGHAVAAAVAAGLAPAPVAGPGPGPQPSPLWGEQGELWNPGGRLTDFSFAGRLDWRGCLVRCACGGRASTGCEGASYIR